MNMMKLLFRLSLILYICMFLTGAPFVLSASAKITPKPNMEGTKLIMIVKGDTLWDLAGKHMNNPFVWEDFKEYNDFTDPDLIYPGESLKLPSKFMLPQDTAEAMVEAEMEMADASMTNADIEAIKTELERSGAELTSTREAILGLKSQIGELSKQNQMLQSNVQQLQNGLNNMEMPIMPMSDAETMEAVGRLNEMLMNQAEASKMEIMQVGSRINKLQAGLNEIGETQKQQGRGIDALNVAAKSIVGGVEMNAKLLGKWEEPSTSKSKRALALLTAVAGGTAWFVVNAIDSSD
jgi:LysM repeat protein